VTAQDSKRKRRLTMAGRAILKSLWMTNPIMLLSAGGLAMLQPSGGCQSPVMS